MSFRSFIGLSLAATIVPFTVACGSPDGAPSSSSPSAASDMVTVTSVHLNDDGTSTIKTTHAPRVTAATPGAGNVEVTSVVVNGGSSSGGISTGGGGSGGSIDPNCAHADLFLYDDYLLSGSYVCLSGNGTLALSSIAHEKNVGGWYVEDGDWARRVKSFYVVDENGSFTAQSGDVFSTETFGLASGAHGVASGLVQAATSVTLIAPWVHHL